MREPAAAPLLPWRQAGRAMPAASPRGWGRLPGTVARCALSEYTAGSNRLGECRPSILIPARRRRCTRAAAACTLPATRPTQPNPQAARALGLPSQSSHAPSPPQSVVRLARPPASARAHGLARSLPRRPLRPPAARRASRQQQETRQPAAARLAAAAGRPGGSGGAATGGGRCGLGLQLRVGDGRIDAALPLPQPLTASRCALCRPCRRPQPAQPHCRRPRRCGLAGGGVHGGGAGCHGSGGADSRGGQERQAAQGALHGL